MQINELCDRYGLARSSLYERLKGLNITLAKEGKKSVATDEQIKLLDDLDMWLKGGTYRRIEDFKPVDLIQATLENEPDSQLATAETEPPRQLDLFADMVKTTVKEVLREISPQSPLTQWRELEDAAKNGWVLSTSQVKQLLGTKPYGDRYQRGCFVFVKAGKIGAETGWEIQKAN